MRSPSSSQRPSNTRRSALASGLFAGGAVLALGLVGCQGTRVSAGGGQDEEWLRLEYDLEHSPIFASSLHWKPVYDEMLKLGIDPVRARQHIRRAARNGPARQDVEELLDQNREGSDLERALAIAFAEHDVSDFEEVRRARTGYPRTEVARTSEDWHWVRLEDELERPPLLASSLGWEPVYRDLVAIGVVPRDVRSMLRRYARWGPVSALVIRVIEEQRGDPGRLLDTLEVLHAESRDAYSSTSARVGRFEQLRGDARPVQALPQVGGPAPAGEAGPLDDLPEPHFAHDDFDDEDFGD